MLVLHNALTQVAGITEVKVGADSALISHQSHQCPVNFVVHFPGLLCHQPRFYLLQLQFGKSYLSLAPITHPVPDKHGLGSIFWAIPNGR
jgi:hypothetical protein